MVARAYTFAFQGLDVLDVDCQVHLAGGLPAFIIVGLADKAVGESRERVRAALQAIGLGLPAKRITVNLSPADVTKEGSHYDLPIALGLLAALDIIPADWLERYITLGELALDGSLTPVSGALPAAVHANARGKGLICPAKNGAEAAWAGEMEVIAPPTLLSLINHVKGTQVLGIPSPAVAAAPQRPMDLIDIKGQTVPKRALEVAAAGRHNLLLVGPPGSGKSMLAARLPGILPRLTAAEALSVSMIHSLAGTLKDGQLLVQRPYRDPHHSASLPALVGGGHRAKPGEISLCHNGVLFLDELPEFSRPVLEALRQPLETGETTIARANAHVTYPARFQLVAAMNPCKCGHLADPNLACSKAPRCGLDYQARLSGPILDRIDLQVEVPAVPVAELTRASDGEPSAVVAARVAAAHALQQERYQDDGITSNAAADGDVLARHTALTADGQKLLEEVAQKFRLSARGYTRVLRVARTLADLEGAATISRLHLAEAIGYRRFSMARVSAAA